MSFWRAKKATVLLANTCGVAMLFIFASVCHGQGSGGGGESSPVSSTPGISGADVQSSELVSKSGEMPKFGGFQGLNVSSFLGNNGNYLLPRDASGANRSITQTRSSSSSRNQTRTSSGATLGSSSGNTRTTGSRTASRSGNRNTSNMGMRGGMGGMGRTGGAGSNTVQAATSLGYSLNEFSETLLPMAGVRAPKIESRINSSRVQPVIPVTVEIKERTAILRGVVKNEHDRRLLEQFVKLEPGIVNVQNELLCSIEDK